MCVQFWRDSPHTDNRNRYRRRVKSDKGGPVQEGEKSPDTTDDWHNSGCAGCVPDVWYDLSERHKKLNRI